MRDHPQQCADAGENEKNLMKLLHYIGRSTKDNVTDDVTRKLDDIVCRTKSKEDVGGEIREELGTRERA